MNRKKLAYETRVKTRASWSVIGDKIGISKQEARRYAFHWAQINNLPSPPPILTGGEMAYEDRAYGSTWEEIRYSLRLATEQHARNMAANYALFHGLEWPPKVGEI